MHITTHVTLSCSVSSGGGFGDVMVMCIANAADNMKGILSKNIDNWEEVNSLWLPTSRLRRSPIPNSVTKLNQLEVRLSNSDVPGPAWA
jgi:hypothetical protein